MVITDRGEALPFKHWFQDSFWHSSRVSQANVDQKVCYYTKEARLTDSLGVCPGSDSCINGLNEGVRTRCATGRVTNTPEDRIRILIWSLLPNTKTGQEEKRYMISLKNHFTCILSQDLEGVKQGSLASIWRHQWNICRDEVVKARKVKSGLVGFVDKFDSSSKKDKYTLKIQFDNSGKRSWVDRRF